MVGEGRPVVAIHGMGEDHRHMVVDLEPVFVHYSKWKRIYPDLPGHGKTPAPDWITSNDQMLDVVLEFIDEVTNGERFLLVGRSYGGYLARGVVNRRPSLIDGLLLWVPVVTYGKRTLPSQVLTGNKAVTPHINQREKELIGRLPRYREDPSKQNQLVRRLIANFSFDHDGFPERLESPTLIVCGRQDSVVGYVDQWRVLENYPNATFALLDGADHLLGQPGIREETFKILARDWLNRVCAPRGAY
jgi:pimeloyl-ACP methyl ester carboxylesterase